MQKEEFPICIVPTQKQYSWVVVFFVSFSGSCLLICKIFSLKAEDLSCGGFYLSKTLESIKLPKNIMNLGILESSGLVAAHGVSLGNGLT